MELKAVFWKVVVNGLWSTIVNASILVCSFGIVHALFKGGGGGGGVFQCCLARKEVFE